MALTPGKGAEVFWPKSYYPRSRLLDLDKVVERPTPMISSDQVAAMIKTSLPDANVQVEDLTGGGDHYQVLVVSSAFAGCSLVQQHQLVYGAVREAMSSAAIHALALKTYTPEDWARLNQA